MTDTAPIRRLFTRTSISDELIPCRQLEKLRWNTDTMKHTDYAEASDLLETISSKKMRQVGNTQIDKEISRARTLQRTNTQQECASAQVHQANITNGKPVLCFQDQRTLLSTTNKICCSRCGASTTDSPSPAASSIYGSSASKHGTNDIKFLKFKRLTGKLRNGESASGKCTKETQGYTKWGCTRCGGNSVGRQCKPTSENFKNTSANCECCQMGDNMSQCSICCSSVSPSRRSFSVRSQRSNLDRDRSISSQSTNRCEQFIGRLSIFKHSKRLRQYLQRRNLRHKSDLPSTGVINRVGRRNKDGKNKTNFLILTWIINTIGYLLHFTSTISSSILYRKSNGFTRNCVTFALWTLIIIPGDSKRVLGNSLLVSPGQFCTRSRFLNAKQLEICRNHSDILKHVEEGVVLGHHRCKKEFQYNRWNCSSSPKTYYSRLLNQDVRETAYVSAVTSAAVTYAVTYACTKGDIPNCGCAERYISSYDLLKQEAHKRNVQVTEAELQQAAATFEWGGCGDIVEYGEEISRIFTDHFGRKQISRDLRGKIEEHNFEAGRLAVTNHMRRECRCHGFTGTCTLQTCWDKMPKWQDVGVRLRAKFDKAVRVQLANDGLSLLPTRKQRLAIKEYPYPRHPYPDSTLNRLKRDQPGIYPPVQRTASGIVATDRRRRRRRRQRKSLKKRKVGGRTITIDDSDLVYSQESPNFCKRIRKHGTLGTSGRRCIPNSSGAGSCDYLCCGRGVTQHQETVTRQCNCRMETCCVVTCDECTVSQTVYTCN